MKPYQGVWLIQPAWSLARVTTSATASTAAPTRKEMNDAQSMELVVFIRSALVGVSMAMPRPTSMTARKGNSICTGRPL